MIFRLKSYILLLIPVLSIFLNSCKWIQEPVQPSAYITQVFDYVYAPGQHALAAKKTDVSNFIGEPSDYKDWLYLGGFGGYVVAGFDHNVVNGSGFDFEVLTLKGSSLEPGIVYVMSDTNGDGLPNETWYELKGNLYNNFNLNYWVRYYKAVSDTSNITWKDSNNDKGVLKSGSGSKCTSTWWWPNTTTDSITFHGRRLPDPYISTVKNGVQSWIVLSNLFTWGYVKNLYGTDYDSDLGGNKFEISNAVDTLGKAVYLPHIRFIKVQTAVLQQAGVLNEVSTEVRGAKDLRK
ncbi:MAG: hypothetical protein WCL70_07265 [Paludibacter sp.]